MELACRTGALASQCPPGKRSKAARVARRAARLLRKSQFARAASLARRLGVADATPDTLAALRTLFPDSFGVSEIDLHDHYGSVAPPPPDALPVEVTLDTLRTFIAMAPPLSTPHKDGWRVEYMVPLVANQSCGEALATLTTTRIRVDVSNKIADLLSSATLVILLKKDDDTKSAMKEAFGVGYLQPHRPLGTGSNLVKIASNYALLLLRGSLGAASGPSHFTVETKGVCDLI